METDFNDYWKIHRDRLLREDPEYSEAIQSYAMKSGADWLLFGLPVVAGIVAMQVLPIAHELLRFALSVVITIIAFAISVYIKSLINPHRSLSDIEKDVKARTLEKWEKSKNHR